MKTRFLLVCLSVCLAVTSRLSAQDEDVAPIRTQQELDQLFGPIALYPDALVALILPAATVPSDVVLAARFLRDNGDPSRLESESWDDSVKSLSHYPDVVKWMDENLAWTKQAGEAFAAQPADVMKAIQRLRAAARAAGTLTDTPQQRIVIEEDNIAIIPADPEVIYVPRYDPEVVYVSRPYYHDPFLTFGVGFSTGVWLGCYDFDWGRHRLCTIDRRDRERYWHDHLRHREWRRDDWHHDSHRVVPGPSHPRIVEDNRFRREDWRPRRDVHRPTHVSGGVVRPDANRFDSTPHRSPDQRPDDRRNDNDRRNDDRRPHRGPDGSRDDNRRPNINNASPGAVNSNGVTSVQPPRVAPAPNPTVTNPATASQPTQTAPRPDRGRRDRSEQEARGRERSATPQNPQGRVMQLQSPVQPRPQQTTPAVVNREARAPQSQPPHEARERAAPPVQARPQQTAVNIQPREPRPQISRQDNNNSSGNDRKDRDERRDRPQR